MHCNGVYDYQAKWLFGGLVSRPRPFKVWNILPCARVNLGLLFSFLFSGNEVWEVGEGGFAAQESWSTHNGLRD